MDWRDVAATDEVPEGRMMRLDIEGREVTVARVGAVFYAFDDRCPHMNSPLHLGFIQGGEVVCPLHKARFDLATGKQVTDPKIPIPKALKMGSMMAGIRTHDLPTYEVKTEGGRVLINLERRKTQG